MNAEFRNISHMFCAFFVFCVLNHQSNNGKLENIRNYIYFEIHTLGTYIKTDSPYQDVSKSTIYGRRIRRTVNRTIRFRDGADSTDVTVTSSLSTSSEFQSLLDSTNTAEQMIFVHCVKFQAMVREDASVLLADYFTMSPAFVQGRLIQMPSDHESVSVASHRFQ